MRLRRGARVLSALVHCLVQAKAQPTGTQRAALLFACVYRPRSCCLRSEKRLVMLHKMFETLGIIPSSGNPAPPMVNTRHQPKPTKASTVRNLQRPDRSPTRAPIDADTVDRDPATVVGLPALKPGNATDLGGAAHRSLTERGAPLPKAMADTIGTRLFPQSALTTAASPQAFVVLVISTSPISARTSPSPMKKNFTLMST